MWTDTANNHHCLSCEYWSGPRRTTTGSWAETEDSSIRAACILGHSGISTPGPIAGEGLGCSDHRPWSALR